MKKYDLIIIGGGASGLVAAVSAKRNHPEYRILILEKLPRVGKKILATGNGRCNITNVNAVSDDYHNGSFTEYVFAEYNPYAVINFFNSVGLYTYTDTEGRVYPRSNAAASVLDVLRYEADRLEIELQCDTEVKAITKAFNGFVVNDLFVCDKLILSTGGKSSPSQGSDGSGYKLAKALGHNVTPCVCSLVPLTASNSNIKSVKGIRAQNVALSLGSCYTTGEILFTENGVSGIAAMELAAEAETLLLNGKKPILCIDFLPDFTVEQLVSLIKSTLSRTVCEEQILVGLLPKMLGLMLIKNTSMSINDKLFSVKLAESVKNYRIEITGTKGFNNSQVTRGGIDVGQINRNTLESKICKGLYFTGELIDIDGPCGGYNLQWAFASGLLSGELK